MIIIMLNVKYVCIYVFEKVMEREREWDTGIYTRAVMLCV